MRVNPLCTKGFEDLSFFFYGHHTATGFHLSRKSINQYKEPHKH